jgi:hypothetical protein
MFLVIAPGDGPGIKYKLLWSNGGMIKEKFKVIAEKRDPLPHFPRQIPQLNTLLVIQRQ